MNWTTEKPTKPGWYWINWDDGSKPDVVEIRDHSDMGQLSFSYYSHYEWNTLNVNCASCQFAGPISDPTEATPI